MAEKQKHLIYVAGPTASGKTSLAIDLATQLNAEIISCDSRQFYQQLKIGAAPPTEEELSKVKHHFIHNVSISEPYNAGAFGRDARQKLHEIHSEQDLAIMVGGSGLYANALMYGFDDLPDADEFIRTELKKDLDQNGLASLGQQLKELDPDYFNRADIDNPHRVMRALEVIKSSGSTMTELLKGRKIAQGFSTTILVMDWPREELYDRINRRVDIMVQGGFEEEARGLFEYAHLQTLNTVGYKEWFAHFRGEISKEDCISLIKQNTRRFAKRQLTWFRKYEEAFWIHPTNSKEIKRILNDQSIQAN